MIYTHVYTELSTFLPVLCLPQFINVFICLPSILTEAYPRSSPFTHVYYFLSTFYPVFRCLRQMLGSSIRYIKINLLTNIQYLKMLGFFANLTDIFSF